jgi:hypothetical protein
MAFVNPGRCPGLRDHGPSGLGGTFAADLLDSAEGIGPFHMLPFLWQNVLSQESSVTVSEGQRCTFMRTIGIMCISVRRD